MYASFDYYTTSYGGLITDESVFNRLVKQADRVMDKITLGKLSFAFPLEESAVDNVYQCECNLVDFIQAVNAIKVGQMQGAGYVTDSDGTIKGKMVSSVSSGSESISYSAGNMSDNVYLASAYDGNAFNKATMDICRLWLGGVADANGVNLMYAGSYPRIR